MSRTYEQARLRAQAKSGHSADQDGVVWASATEHERDLWPAQNRRRKCSCGCGGRATHVGGANGIALTSGCELSMRRWVRDGYAQ